MSPIEQSQLAHDGLGHRHWDRVTRTWRSRDKQQDEEEAAAYAAATGHQRRRRGEALI